MHAPLRPIRRAEYDFLPDGLERLNWSRYTPLSRWVPPELEPGIGLFESHRDVHNPTHKIFALPATGEPMQKVSFRAQKASRFGTGCDGLILTQSIYRSRSGSGVRSGAEPELKSDGHFAVGVEIVGRTRRVQSQTDNLQLRLNAYPLNARLRNFADESTRVVTVEELDAKLWAEGAVPGVIGDATCRPTGMFMIARLDPEGKSSFVAIVHLG